MQNIMFIYFTTIVFIIFYIHKSNNHLDTIMLSTNEPNSKTTNDSKNSNNSQLGQVEIDKRFFKVQKNILNNSDDIKVIKNVGNSILEKVKPFYDYDKISLVVNNSIRTGKKKYLNAHIDTILDKLNNTKKT